MTSRVVVCYGTPEDPAAFDEHYISVHVPLVRAVPGLVDFVWGTANSLDGSEPPYYQVAYLVFADGASLKEGLASPEMKTAGKDVRNFASGGATMFTQDDLR